MRRWLRASVLVIAPAVGVAGCIDGAKDRLRTLETENAQLREQVKSQSKLLLEQESTLREQREQIQNLRALGGPKRFGMLPKTGRVEISPKSGGYNADGKLGDDEIRVYLLPYDDDGDVIKACGAVQVQVLDLANPANQQTICENRWTSEALRKLWYGRFGFEHYRLICPWNSKLAHDTLTVRLVFTDVLTGTSFEAQSVIKVDPGL